MRERSPPWRNTEDLDVRERERENSKGEKERGGDYNQASIISKLKTEKIRSHITMH